MGATVNEITESGQGLGNLLSGGVDSSVLQLILNEKSAPNLVNSFSFAPVRTPSFEFEVKYARQASEIFQTEHTFVHFTPEEYPALVCRAVDIWSLAFLFVVTASAVQKAQKRLKPLLRTPISSAFIVAYPK
ncbi:MAG: hypothetical protein DRP09_17165, partial [Candidatus Thorarchaeota archaeon]